MKISILIPAYNEAAGLAATVQHIVSASAALTARGWDSEIIVCDNNSSDGTADIARSQGATVVFEPVNQISRARNAAAAHATGDWLLFIDADSHPEALLFNDMASAISTGHCLAGGSTLRMTEDGLGVRIMTGLWNLISRLTHWAAGCFIFVERAAFEELGGFSEVLYASEEIELFRRLKRAARPTGRHIVILHRHPLHTSARKVRLYSAAELTGFLMRTLASGGRNLRSADDCKVWYDGRR